MRKPWSYLWRAVCGMSFILGTYATWVLCPEVLIVIGMIILLMCIPHK